MKKIEIEEQLANEIYENYISGISIRKLSNKYNYSFSYIQKLIKSKDYKKNINKNYPIKNGYVIVAICKYTNKKFYDYTNISGALTNHVKSTYNINLPSKYKRKTIEYKTGKFWYDKYFDFKYEKIQSTKKCKYCDWTTEDIENLSGAYEKHLKNVHNLSLHKHLKNNPDDNEYFKKEIYDDLITCKICGGKFKTITNTHLLKKHNITQLEYKIKYENKLVSPETKNKLIKNYNQFLKNTPYIKTSSIENFIVDNIPVNFDKSNRSLLDGKEIDLLYNNNGFEINGSLFHTEIFGKKDKNYHLNKTKLAQEKGVQLYHIFEDELHYKPQLVINKIKHILKCSFDSKTIHARKCVISDNVTSNQKNEFLNENHIQGSDKSSINIAAIHDDEIVAIMTFNNKRYLNKAKKHHSKIYELSRFAVKDSMIITGIASRLLKYFIKNYNPQKIISFADRRWTPNPDNNLYTKLNFRHTQTLKPEYWYYNPKFDRHKRFHKFGFGKSNIKRKFPEVYDESKTEWEMMQELDFDRIWDCGKFKYELNF
jgi:hypothetical protein